MESPTEFAVWADRISALSENLFCSVIQIFKEDARNRLQAHGTGFLVNDDDSVYLISAAHVLDPLKVGASLFIYSDRNILQKLDGRLCLTKSSSADRSDDKIDVGVLRFATNPPPYANIRKHPVPIQKMRARRLTRNYRQYLLTGFPASKSGLHRVKRKIISSPVANVGYQLDTRYPEGFSEKDHLAISFDQRSGFDENGARINLPSPRGMSGSPIWEVEPLANERDTAFIAGVFIEFHMNQRALIATDIRYALDIIRSEFS